MQERHEQKTEFNDDKILSQLWKKYFPYWPILIILFIAGCFCGWLFLKYQVPIYESTASLLIKDEKKGLDDSKMIESLNTLSTKKIIENEVEVLKSAALMTRVATKLRLYAPIHKETKSLDISIYETAPVTVTAKHPDSLQKSEPIPFTLGDSSINVSGQEYELNKWVSTPYGTLKFARTKSVIDSTAQRLFFSLVNVKEVAGDLVGRLQVSSVNKLSTVLKIKISDAIPRRGEDILNELISVYNQAGVTDKNTLASNTLSFVEARLAVVAKELNSIEKSKQNYKENTAATDISSQGKLFLENVSSNDQKLSEINMQSAVLDQVEMYVLSKDKVGNIVPSTLGITDPLLSQLLERLYSYELEYEKLKRTTGANNPTLVSIVDQIEKLRPSILENIRSQRKGLVATKANLSSTNKGYDSLLRSIPKKERDLVEISRQQQIIGDIYTFLLQKREEASLSYSASVPDSRIIDMAQTSLYPVSPNKKFIYLVSVFLFVAAGFTAITLKDMFTKTILYRHEIEKLTKFPIIGEIPFDKSKKDLVIGNGERTFIAEQFRKLRSSITNKKSIINVRRILITSSVSNDGKSFVAANLALSLAIANKKVALLEFDLTNPSISKRFNIDPSKGLSDFLGGKAGLVEIIKKTEQESNLYIFPSGCTTSNPSELIMSSKVEELLNYLDDHFDFIIFDSAPVSSLSDAYVLANHCDHTLFVVRHNNTPKVLVERLDEDNRFNELGNLSIVFNGVRSRGFANNNYNYGNIYFEKNSYKNGYRNYNPAEPNKS